MRIILYVETNLKDLTIDYIEINSKKYGNLNISWDESYIHRTTLGDKQKHNLVGISFRDMDKDTEEEYSNGKLDAFDDFEITAIGLYSEQEPECTGDYARLLAICIEDDDETSIEKEYEIPIDMTAYNK